MGRHIYEKLEPEDKLYVYDVSLDHMSKFKNTVNERDPAKIHQLETLHSLESFIKNVDKPLDFIVTMVPEGSHVFSIIRELIEVYKKEGNPEAKTTFIDSSTIDIPTSRKIHEFVKTNVSNFDFIDTPVSGGVLGARNGTLSFMLSRPDHESVLPELRTLISKMGSNIFPCGLNHGSGLAAKLSNNYLLAVTNLAVADSFQLAKSFGLNMQHYARLVAVSTGKSWASVDNCPIKGAYPEEMKLPCENDYHGGFVTKLTRKDLVLATDAARANDRSLFMGEVSRHWYDKACEDKEIANKDLGVLYEWLGTLK